MRLVIPSVVGFVIGISLHALSSSKLNFMSSPFACINLPHIDDQKSEITTQMLLNLAWTLQNHDNPEANVPSLQKILVTSNPVGAETLPPGIVVAESDYFPRRLEGSPAEDLSVQPKYLVTFTVGYEQRHNIDAAVKRHDKLSQKILPFCYFIMMDKSVHGISLNGRRKLSILVLESRLNGGMQKDSCIQILWQHTTTYLYGMKIWELSTSMQRNT